MFSSSLQEALRTGARDSGIDPAALLALVEIETNGAPFEQDGVTPAFLYERHIAWREAGKVSLTCRAAFARAGLAIPQWSRATQYKDQGSSTRRLDLIGRARAIDEEVANLSASWGVGQIMGFHARDLGFASATSMVAHMTGNIDHQVACLIALLRHMRLVAPLNAGDWPRVARIYNGPGYAANRYDVRLADACKRWRRRLADDAPANRQPPIPRAVVLPLQQRLRGLGYVAVGAPDGVFGSKTVAALAQFQSHEGLPITGVFDAATQEALRTAEPIAQPLARQEATADDLAASGSQTVRAAHAGGVIAQVKALGGAVFLGGGVASYGGLLDGAQKGLDTANQARGVWESFRDLAAPLFGSPMAMIAGAVLIASALALWWVTRTVIAHRLADHRSGVHAGPSGR